MFAATLIALAAAAEDPTTETRPYLLLLNSGFGTPTGLYGGTLGYRHWEVGGGLGLTGWQVSAQRRAWLHPEPWERQTSSWSFGVGPSVGFYSEDLGFHVARAEGVEVDPHQLFYASWLNGDASYEYRGERGFTFRATLGVGLRLLQNQGELCEGEEMTREYTDCYPPHFASAPLLAQAPFLPYLGLSYGYAFGRRE